ncbi:nuclear transport factor 2 family protein [Isoptericola sp. F-RaC21]|uniref:YybH family protein n=1 Tax=Isoptericola sp. F-RaC21 TaxID=3141452 RepID=UPI00315C1ABA
MVTRTEGQVAEWAEFQAAQRSALAALVAGDPHDFQRLWDHTPGVSLLGAFGGVARGWDQVRDRLAAVAVTYGNGVYQRLDQLDEHVHGDMAYTVHVEEIHSRPSGGERVVRERRVTKVYRRTGAGWRIVHMHADPLVTTAFPDDTGINDINDININDINEIDGDDERNVP